jgi:hypothetical protein
MARAIASWCHNRKTPERVVFYSLRAKAIEAAEITLSVGIVRLRTKTTEFSF